MSSRLGASPEGISVHVLLFSLKIEAIWLSCLPKQVRNWRAGPALQSNQALPDRAAPLLTVQPYGHAWVGLLGSTHLAASTAMPRHSLLCRGGSTVRTLLVGEGRALALVVTPFCYRKRIWHCGEGCTRYSAQEKQSVCELTTRDGLAAANGSAALCTVTEQLSMTCDNDAVLRVFIDYMVQNLL